jgi:predicted acetyltransferase
MAYLNPSIPGRKLAAVSAIISLPFAYLTQALFMMASDGDVAMFHDGQQMLNLAQDKASMFYAAMWTDILGYYLIFLPVIIYAWKIVREIDESLTDISFLCGLIYCLLGSFGAVNMAGAFDALYASYAALPVSEQTQAIAAWEATIAGNWRGYWLLEAVLAAIWLGGLGRLLIVAGLKGLGIGAISLAIIWVAQFSLWQVGTVEASDAALALVVILSPLWAVWLGLTLLRLQSNTITTSPNQEKMA